MRKWLIGSLLAAAAASPTAAALPEGSRAPDFTTSGAVGGKAFKLHLADQLRKGPVVLYFFPKAFTIPISTGASTCPGLSPRFSHSSASASPATS